MRLNESRKKLTPVALTVLRVVAGIVMAAHGLQKLSDMQAWKESVAAMGIPGGDVAAWLAVAGELGGGVGLILGALTPIAALGVLATMITAIVKVHLGNGLFAQNNGWEYPLIIACVAVYFVFRGAGPLSVDALVQRARARRRQEPAETGGTAPAGGRPLEHGV